MPPENVRCAPLTSQSLQISWQPPPTHHTNGLLQGYKVNFEFMSDLIGGMNDDIDSRKTTELTIVLTGLKKVNICIEYYRKLSSITYRWHETIIEILWFGTLSLNG